MKRILFAGMLVVLGGCKVDEPGSVSVGTAGDPPDNPVPYVYEPPEEIGDGWQTGSLKHAGIDENRIVDLADTIRDGAFAEVDSILIARGGKLVFELYPGEYDRDDRHEVRSVSKSVVSMLAGIAIYNGFIPDVRQKVLPLFPEYAPYGEWDDRKNDITVEHLLTMSTGLDCDDTDGESQGREVYMFASDDWVRHFIELPMLRDPGAEFHYCAGSVVALAGVIEKYTGQKNHEFARTYLFEPLGIDSYNWTLGPQGKLHPNGLSLRPRDMLKLGQLMLDGSWNGRTMLSMDWIEQSTAHQVTDAAGDTAGYLWWRTELEVDGNPEDVFFAHGAGGQSIIVIPSHETVIVLTARNFRGRALRYGEAVVSQYIAPAL
ncbi:MAG TPA: serine hydrolase [Gammaproteobacteria bacterium]